MAEIRSLERGDLPNVAKLLDANLPPWAPKAELESSLADTYLDTPWTDDELPSLVATEDDRVVGFIGAQVRRFRFDDRILRGVCPSHLTVDPASRGGATGALIFRRMLTAGQDFTYSDTANDEVVQMCRTFGGDLDHSRACDWMIVLRPARWLRALAADVTLRRHVGPDVQVGALPFKAIRPGHGQAAPEPGIEGADVDAAGIVEALGEMSAGIRLRGDYDRGFLDHLFSQVEAQFDRLERRVVRREGRPVGWYAFVPLSGAVIRVLHLMAGERDGDAVLSELLAHARGAGAAVVSGRVEPHLTQTLGARAPVVGFARRPWIHCRDPEIRATLGSSASLLTQLDAEWFLI
jgi:GNAT superfamily N-acetyltransferase